MIGDLIAGIGQSLLTLVVRILPYFVLGAATAAVLETSVSPRWTARLLDGSAGSVWLVSLVAAILPGCSCATVPMTEGLRRRGARLGTMTAFLMMSPLLAPHTVILTWGMLGWRFALARVLIPFLVVPPLGMLLNTRHGQPGWRLPPLPISGGSFTHPECGCEGSGTAPCNVHPQQRTHFLRAFLGILRQLAKPFVLGLAIATTLTTLLPEDAIPRTIGAAGPLAFLVAALIGIPVYVCEGEEVPLTYAALNLGLAAGPAFTFLLSAVGTCIPTMLMARSIIGPRATGVYIGAWFVFAIGAGLLFGALY